MSKAPYSIIKRIFITVLVSIVVFFAYIFIFMQYLFVSDTYITKIDSDGTQLLKDNLDPISALPEGSTLVKAQYREGLYLGQGGLTGSFIEIYVTVPESSSDVKEYIERYFPYKEDAKILSETNSSIEMVLHILLREEDEAVHAWASENIDFIARDVANTLFPIVPFVIFALIWFPYEKIRKRE